MSSTAFDDQFTVGTQTIVLHQAYDTVAILRRNVADLEIALRTQTERAESYAETLRSLASYVGAGGYNADTVDAGVFEEKIRWGIGEIMTRVAPVPEPTDEQIHTAYRNAIGQSIRERDMPEIRKFSHALLQSTQQANAVPADHFRGVTKLISELCVVLKELADDAEFELLNRYSDKERYPSLMLKFNNDMALVNQARALLQSAEVHK